MQGSEESIIPVSIAFGGRLRILAEANEAETLRRRLATDLAALVERLGLAGEPVVTIEATDAERAVTIRVRGVLQPYPPRLMWRVWHSRMPVELRDLPMREQPAYQAGFPDGWLQAYVEAAGQGAEHALAPLFDYLAQLILATIELRPACLVDSTQAARIGTGDVGSQLDNEVIAKMPHVAQELVRLGVSLGQKGAGTQLAALVRREIALGHSAEDIVEIAYAHLRSDTVGVHIHPDYLQLLFPDLHIERSIPVYAEGVHPSAGAQFRLLEEALFFDIGIRLPELVLVADPEIQPPLIAVRVNDYARQPVEGIHPGELFVSHPLAQVRTLKIPARPFAHPVSDTLCAVVQEADRGVVEAAGLTVWTPLDLLNLILADELRSIADRFVSLDIVEFYLAQLDQFCPELVRTALMRFAIEDITRVARALVAEGISLRYLKDVLERLLQYDMLPIDMPQHIVFDERIEIGQETRTGVARHAANLLAFIRSGLKYQISYCCAGVDSALSVFLLDKALETRLLAVREPGMAASAAARISDEEQAALRQLFWQAVENAVDFRARAPYVVATGQRIAVLTTQRLRATLRDVLEPELPNVPVVAFGDLRADMSITELARIGA